MATNADRMSRLVERFGEDWTFDRDGTLWRAHRKHTLSRTEELCCLTAEVSTVSAEKLEIELDTQERLAISLLGKVPGRSRAAS